MSRFIAKPTVVEAAGLPPKLIEEFVGRVNTQDHDISIARMASPVGWTEPGQTPEFDEHTLVLRGTLHVEMRKETFQVEEGQAFVAYAGQWVRYSTPQGAEYISVCLPAFSPTNVHRDPH